MREEGRRNKTGETAFGNANRLTELVQCVLDGDADAFGSEMYLSLWDLGSPIARAILGPKSADWEDCVHDAILSLHNVLKEEGAFKWPPSKASSFFQRIVRNRALDYLRRKRIRVLIPSEDIETLVESWPDAAAECEEQEALDCLRHCLAKLPLEEQIVIVRRYLASEKSRPRPFREVGDELGLSHTEVSRRERRALEQLRECLGEALESVTVSAVADSQRDGQPMDEHDQIESLLIEYGQQLSQMSSAAQPTRECLPMRLLEEIAKNSHTATEDQGAHLKSCRFCAGMVGRIRDKLRKTKSVKLNGTVAAPSPYKHPQDAGPTTDTRRGPESETEGPSSPFPQLASRFYRPLRVAAALAACVAIGLGIGLLVSPKPEGPADADWRNFKERGPEAPKSPAGTEARERLAARRARDPEDEPAETANADGALVKPGGKPSQTPRHTSGNRLTRRVPALGNLVFAPHLAFGNPCLCPYSMKPPMRFCVRHRYTDGNLTHETYRCVSDTCGGDPYPDSCFLAQVPHGSRWNRGIPTGFDGHGGGGGAGGDGGEGGDEGVSATRPREAAASPGDLLRDGQRTSSAESGPPKDQANVLPYVFAAVSAELSEDEAHELADLMHVDPEDRNADMSVTDLAVVREGAVPEDPDFVRQLGVLFDPAHNAEVIVIGDFFIIPQSASLDDDIIIDEITVLGGVDCVLLFSSETDLPASLLPGD